MITKLDKSDLNNDCMKHIPIQTLESILKIGQITPSIRQHLESCKACWSLYNRVRWDRAKLNEEFWELKEFLGSKYCEYFDSSWALANEWNDEARETKKQIDDFYRTTEHYVYNLFIWEASGQRPDYVDMAAKHIGKLGLHRILDFGCGIGTDGLKFIELGYDVTFHDFEGPSRNFLQWRLNYRNQIANFSSPDAIIRETEFDLIWAMDVIEHIKNPIEVLEPYLKLSKAFIFDTEHSGSSNGRHPFHFDHSQKEFVQFLKGLGFSKQTSGLELQVWSKV